MDHLKAQLERIQQQLGGLSASQKMLTGTLLVIVVLTLFWWTRYAGEPEMQPVLDQSFASDDITRITAQLAGKQISYRVSGDKILVPADRKFEVLADLGYAQLLPRDTRSGFDEIVKQINPFSPESQNRVMWNRAKELTLAQVIRNFPDVANAVVIIDPTEERRLTGSRQASATVNISLRGGDKPSKNLINAAADVVAGAQGSLARDRIRVIVNGVSYPVHDRGGNSIDAGGDVIELIQQHERRYVDKILGHLSFIPSVLASVTVDLNLKSVEEQRTEVDPTKLVHKEIQTEVRTEESTAPMTAGSEAGVLPNAGMAIAPAPTAGGGSTSSSNEKTTFELQTSKTVSRSTMPAGNATVVAASVRVPRSFFVSIFKASNPVAKDPEDAVLAPLIAAELPKIRRDVQACTGLKNDEAITVETYTDVMPVLTGSPPASATSMASMVGSHAKEVALGALAIVSLGMMAMMVRRSGGAPAAPPPRPESVRPGNLTVQHALAGEAGEGAQPLDGMELDAEAVKAQQMLDQVSHMVKENPDGAANLVKRWLNRA